MGFKNKKALIGSSAELVTFPPQLGSWLTSQLSHFSSI